MNSNFLARNIEILNNLNKKKAEVLLNIIQFGIETHNYPTAEKFANELVDLNKNNHYFLLKRAEVHVFVNPELTKKDLDRIENLSNIKNIDFEKRYKLLKLKYYFSIEEYEKVDKFLDKNNPESVIYYEFSKSILEKRKMNFEKYKGFRKEDFVFFSNVTRLLDYFKMREQFKEWYYYGKNIFKGKEEKTFLELMRLNVLLNNSELDKIKKEDIDEKNFTFLEFNKCFNLASGNIGKYWELRNKQKSTIVNIISSYNFKRYKKNVDIKGKSLLITTSEGFGDNIMSYQVLIEFLNKNKETDITFLVFKEMVSLFKYLLRDYKNVNILEYLKEEDHNKILKNKIDYYIYLSELIGEMDINTKEDFKKLHNNNPLKSDGFKKKILINWKTTPRNIDTRQKSFRLEDFLNKIDIESLKGKEIITIQKEITEKEKSILKKHDIQIITVKDFKDSFEVISECEEVYTNDTVVLHLGGFLGKKTKVYINKHIDCKFIDNKENKKHYLYPNLKIIK